MKVCSVIVTYGDRFHLLKQVMDACYTEGIDKIIVIDNNSEENSKKQLIKYEQIEKRLKVVYLNENTGSAGGYKIGLEEAHKSDDCEFIWLLDDDNKPEKDSLRALVNFWNNLEQDHKKEKISLLSYRKDRIAFKEAIMTNNPDLVLGRKNSFLGFHVLDLPKKIIRVLKRKKGISTFRENKGISSGKVSVAPYGGMFFHKNIINTISYPNADFFVYADDHDWSYRITKNGGSIYLILDSMVNDIDTSWNVSKINEKSYQLIANGDIFRVYYSTRNRVFFEINNLVNNILIYKINIFIFKYFVKLSDDSKKNYNNFLNAISDGLNKKLGRK